MTSNATPARPGWASIEAANQAELWNEQFPPGTPVHYWPGIRVGAGRASKTRTDAWVMGGHTAVVAVEGFSGGIALAHVQPVEAERPTWDWTNNLTRPSTIRVEPSFRPELGAVFVGIGEWSGSDHAGWSGPHHGIWLDREQAARLVRAVQDSAAWSEAQAGE